MMTRMNIGQTVVNGIAKHLGIPPSEQFSITHVGPIPGNPIRHYVLCPNHGDFLTPGRKPEVALDGLRFARGGKLDYRKGEGEWWEESTIYCGRCESCGAVLVGTAPGGGGDQPKDGE